MFRFNRSRSSAFTLLELILVLLVLAVLSAIAVPVYNTVKTNTAERAVNSTLESIDRAGEAAFSSESGMSSAGMATAAVEGLADADGTSPYVSGNRTITVVGDTVTVTLVSGSETVEGSVTFDSSTGEGIITAAGGGAGAPGIDPATLTASGTFFTAIGPGGADCTSTTLCATWTSNHTVLWYQSSSGLYAWFPNSWWNDPAEADDTRYDDGVAPTVGSQPGDGYCDQQTTAMQAWNRYTDAGGGTVQLAADPCLGF